MRFPLLQPRWLGIHVLAVLAAACCFVFGYWQFERAQEPSRGVITNPAEDPSAASDLRTVLEPGEFMHESEGNAAVVATGEYDDEAELLVPAHAPDSGDKGYNVIAPLVTEEGTAVAVHRGWVSADSVDTPDDLAPLPDGEVTVTGWIQMPETSEEGYVPMDLPEGQVERIAPSVLMNAWPYQLYEGHILLAGQDPADASGGGSGVRPQEASPPDPPEEIEWNWRSLSYAAQWVVFGIAVLVFWIVQIRRELEGARPNGTDGEPPRGDGDRPGGAPASPVDDHGDPTPEDTAPEGTNAQRSPTGTSTS